jgi:predicted outer membrane repeat protein
MLAVVTVDNDLDLVNGDTSSIAALIADDGGDGIALREAVEAANNTLGADTVHFAASLDGDTILLGGTELEVTEALAIDARELAGGVTIDAQENSRVMNITATTGDFTLAGLTLTGGRTTGDNVDVSNSTFSGGAVRSLTAGNLEIDQSTVSSNSTAGDFARGGAIYASGNVTLTRSTVSRNSTGGDFARGGGIYGSGNVTLTQSTVSGNSTAGRNALGGGILARGNVTLTESTVSGNSTAGERADGGGILTNDVTLTQSTVSGNSTAGVVAYGGGILANDVTLNQSTVSGNSTAGERADGGGILANDVTLTQSTVSGNSTAGIVAYGGGIWATNVTLTQSTVSGNSTAGPGADGGGIWARGNVALTESTVSGNSTAGDRAGGGGIAATDVMLTQSTLSGNSTAGDSAHGGGIMAFNDLTFTRSTVTDNHAHSSTATGGGIWNYDDPIVISGSIIAGNTAGGGNPDINLHTGTLTADYSLIGTGVMPDSGAHNIVTNDPMLAALADNGGPTETHALLPGSPAIDAGDPGFVPPPEFDQRGAPFARVVGAAIDIGAFEVQAAPTVEELLRQYVDEGVLNRGQANSLAVKLQFKGNELAKPKRQQAFVNHVGAFVRAGILSEDQGQALIDALDRHHASALRQQAANDAALEDDYDTGASVADELTDGVWPTSSAFDSVLDKLTGKRREHKRAPSAF